MHQAGIVAGRADFCLRLAEAVQFFFQHRSGDVRILDGEGPAETTALLHAFERDHLDIAHMGEQPYPKIAQMQAAQRMAAGMIGDAMGVNSTHIFDAQAMHQQFCGFLHPWQQRPDFGLKKLVARGRRNLFVVFPDHRNA